VGGVVGVQQDLGVGGGQPVAAVHRVAPLGLAGPGPDVGSTAVVMASLLPVARGGGYLSHAALR
jgi:hypothetical protein